MLTKQQKTLRKKLKQLGFSHQDAEDVALTTICPQRITLALRASYLKGYREGKQSNL